LDLTRDGLILGHRAPLWVEDSALRPSRIFFASFAVKPLTSPVLAENLKPQRSQRKPAKDALPGFRHSQTML